MWRIENVELRPAKLNFTSSEQGWRDVTQLFADGVQVINAVELMPWDLEDDTQFLICEQCGYFHCKRGDWVRVRRTDSMLLLLPAFDYVWPEEEEDRMEYSPPRYLRERGGVAYLDRSNYETLALQHSDFPAFERIPHLNLREAALIFHWTAPAQLLGFPPEIRLNKEIVLTNLIDIVENLLSAHYADQSKASLRPLTEHDHVTSIHLDAAEFTDWKPLVLDGNDHRLVVDSRFVIVPVSGG